MRSDSGTCTPPGTPPRRQRRAKRVKNRSYSSSSSSSEEDEHRRHYKAANTLSTKKVFKLLKRITEDKSKGSFSNSNFTNVIPEFDPSNRAQSIECWLRKVNECAAIYGWDSKQIVHFSLQKLVGLAKRWFESLPSVAFTWDEWQAKLRKAFPSEENYGRLLEEMLKRTSRNDESLREYFYDKLSLLNRCDIIGKKAVDCIIYGISDRSIRNGAQTLNSHEPEDLLNYLASQKPQIFDSRQGERISQKSFKSSVPSTSKSISTNNSLTCYNCRSQGHPYYKCTKPILKCRRCNRIGHDNDDCKLQPIHPSNYTISINNRSEKKSLKIDSFNNTNDKYFKSVIINEHTFEAYIDFGSECTLMRKTEAESLALLKIFDGLPVVRGFGHSTVTPLYKSSVNIKIDEIESCIEVLIVDDAFLQTSLLIGQNLTELPFVTVLKDNSKLIFYNSPSQNLFGRDEDVIKLHVSNTVDIFKTELVPVHTKSSFTGDVFIEGYNAIETGNEYRLFQGIFNISGGKGGVLASNLSSHVATLSQDKLIARSIPITEHTLCQINQIFKDPSKLAPLDKNDIKTGPDLDNHLLDKLYLLLQSYRDCFATCLGEIGCVDEVKIKIDLIDNRPIVYRPYRLSHHERQQVRETVDELLQNDIIQESNSDYASPILMVKKKTGEQRLCVDFRALNNKTIKDRFPLPLIEDQISNLSGNCFFTTLDLASGYYQISVAEECRHLTGFVTPDGHYEFKRMPFGLANAPAVFQRMINKILGNRRFEYALAYLDDVLIPSKSVDEMFQRLEELLRLFRQYGLTLKLTKCRFFEKTVNYLGYDISVNGIQPGKARVLAVKEFPTPSNVHEVRQFLGLTGYFRKFIKGYGEVARPLTSLLRKEASWKWSNAENAAFLFLKEKLIELPVLALYDPTLETEVHTDASSLGVGGILLQWQRNIRVLKPVAYFSRQTTPEEKHLHSYELETLAVVCTLKKFRVYLLGLNFKVLTDCAALRTTLTKRDLVPRIARWWLQISEFTFEIDYRPGVQMTHVDALSRNTDLSMETDDNPSISVYNIEKENWLLTLQIADPDISRILKVLKPGDDQECKDIRRNYVVKNHTVFRKVNDKLCLVVPRSARWQICRANHDDIGHLGYAKTLERMEESYWFPKLRKFVKKYISACIECAYNKDNKTKRKSGFLYPINKIQIPFHTIHMDHLGPFVRSKDGNTHILTVVDAFTKYLFVRAVKDLKTKSTIKVIERIFYDFGVPARIISDRGTSFTSKAFKTFCDTNGIKHILNAVACPRANGQAERFNQTILNSLSAQNSFGHERDWDKCLGKIQWGINNTVNATTQQSATEAMFGVKMRDSLSNKLNTLGCSRNLNLQEIRDKISENIEKEQAKQKDRYDANRVPATKYAVGDLVKISRNNFDNDKKSTKLLSKFVGPYKITEVLGNDRYKIADVPGFSKKGKLYTTVIAADRIRPWIHIKTLELYKSDISTASENTE
ncbi:unnamed protein product [Parnassius mnemosyne]|uniref:RNA-directed DNA polymerase n=1 Tax=Parnassius mnemosyne TaxID=213953 RepID=A0AAV1MBC4_9NEOP